MTLVATLRTTVLKRATIKTSTRCMGSRPFRINEEPLHPNQSMEDIKPSKYFGKPEGDDDPDPMKFVRKPVTSAHSIDLTTSPPKLSIKDSAVLTPTGTVVHGRYGELPAELKDGTIPLEYLALLHPAAQGAAALREIESGEKGTVLVYGAGEPHALSTTQLASASGHAVIAVVAGNQSGNDEFLESVKSMVSEPGTAVPEEYAILKGKFRELVNTTVEGEDMSSFYSPEDHEEFLEEFRNNAVAYAEKFPTGIPATVDPEEYKFKGKEKDREHFAANMEAYLSQFPQGVSALDPTVLRENFTVEQYAAFKKKFHVQATKIISGDETVLAEFEPAEIVKSMSEVPEKVESSVGCGEDNVPYEFSILDNNLQNGMEVKKGGPIVGAVIGVTPELKTATEAVEKAGKSMKAKAEALQFLTEPEKNAFAAASSVAKLAKEAGKPVVVVGGQLPGFQSVEPTDEDVKTVLSAMEIDDDGTSRLNYFLQLYRASDYAVYEDYAIHRATEPLAGPRQIIVTK